MVSKSSFLEVSKNVDLLKGTIVGILDDQMISLLCSII